MFFGFVSFVSCFVRCVCVSPTDRVASGAKRRSPTSALGVVDETTFLTQQ